MSREKESHIVPALVAVIGVVSFSVLVYLFILGADWVLNRVLGTGAGTPI